MSNRIIAGAAAAALMLVLAGAGFARPAEQRPGDIDPLTQESVTGPDTYGFYCAPCHGRTGKGDGPVAPALKTRMPDLTTIARRAGGRFPKAEITTYVAGRGRATAAHGSVNMPTWGPAFRMLEGTDSRISVRLLNVVDYLESIQVKK